MLRLARVPHPAPMNDKTYNVLFLCTGNSARSLMAEALLNTAGGRRFRAFSAGSHPAADCDPFTMEQIRAIGYANGDVRSKSWDEYSQPGAPKMDFVITVCDIDGGEACPRWPGQPATANWNFRDPAAVQGPDKAVRQEYATISREIKTRVEIFRSLPDETLDKLALQREIAKIARV